MFKMVDNRVKQEGKILKRFIEEFVEAKPKNWKKINITDRNIYPSSSFHHHFITN